MDINQVINKRKKAIKNAAKATLWTCGILLVLRGALHADVLLTAKMKNLLNFDEPDYKNSLKQEPGYRNNHPLVVSISEEFNDYYKKEVLEAIEYVDSIAEGIKFIVIMGNEKDADIIIVPDSELEHLGTAYRKIGQNGSGYIKINDDLIHTFGVKATVAHELGHVLGLDHTKDSSSLMYPVAPRSKFSKKDIKNINTLWPAGDEEESSK